MGKLSAFQFITLNGYLADASGDIGWHKHGAEEAQYSAESLKSGNTLLFGRVTFEQMASYWPTPIAVAQYPFVAEGMNKAEKIVVSRTLERTTWNNTRLVKDNFIAEVQSLKQGSKDITLLGSGSVLTQLAEHNLIDEYQIMLNPVALDEGKALFKDMRRKLDLQLIDSRIFKSGVVLLTYQPV